THIALALSFRLFAAVNQHHFGFAESHHAPIRLALLREPPNFFESEGAVPIQGPSQVRYEEHRNGLGDRFSLLRHARLKLSCACRPAWLCAGLLGPGPPSQRRLRPLRLLRRQIPSLVALGSGSMQPS